MLRYRLWMLIIVCCLFTSLAHAELKVGVGKTIITPDPLLPVSGGVGPSNPATGKQGELTARAMVFEPHAARDLGEDRVVLANSRV